MIAPSVHVVSKDVDTLMGFLVHTASVIYPGERILFRRQFSSDEAALACGGLANPVMQIESVPHEGDISGYLTFRIPGKNCDLRPHFASTRECLSAVLSAAAATAAATARVGLEFKVFTRQPGEHCIVIGLTTIQPGG